MPLKIRNANQKTGSTIGLINPLKHFLSAILSKQSVNTIRQKQQWG